MVKGMHLMSVARGRDPRELAIVGFGGAGPLHACELAAALGTGEVIIPPLPGNTSAVGLALASVRRERSRAVLRPLAELDEADAAAVLDELADEVTADLAEDGVAPDRVSLEAVARVSYEGQRYQIDIPLPASWTPGTSFPGSLRDVADTFGRRHRTSYGYTRTEPLSLFGLVVVGLARVGSGHATVTAIAAGTNGTRPAPAVREVWFPGGFRPTPVLSRASLEPGTRFEGPAIIDQPDSTTVVPPGWAGAADEYGSLVLTLG
jgi:N-methylhydantoinase A